MSSLLDYPRGNLSLSRYCGLLCNHDIIIEEDDKDVAACDEYRGNRPRSACFRRSRSPLANKCENAECPRVRKETRNARSKSLTFQQRNCRSGNRSNPVQNLSLWSLDESAEEAAADNKFQLAAFKRCLRMIGVNGTDVEEEARRKSPAPNIKNSRPTIVTRLRERSVSVSDIKEVVDNFTPELLLDEKTREIITKAVYEEWYFKKLSEQRKSLDEKRREEEALQSECERKKLEQKLKAERSFKEWMAAKKVNRDEGNASGKGNNKYRPRSGKAFQDWKKEKEAEAKKKAEMEQKEREAKANDERKIDAENAYLAWKKKADADYKKYRMISRKKKEASDAEEARKRVEKEEEARKSFEAWKSNKEYVFKQKQRKQTTEETNRSKARAERLTVRYYEAEQAFLDWLENIERKMKENQRSSAVKMK